MAKVLYKKDSFTDKDGKKVEYEKLYVHVKVDDLECEVKIKVDSAHKDEVINNVKSGVNVDVILETRDSKRDDNDKKLYNASLVYEIKKTYLGKTINSLALIPLELNAAECLLIYLADKK